MNDKILAISFFGSTKHQLKPYENLDNVDLIIFESHPLNLGIPGPVEDFKKMNIDYTKYFAVITWGDSLFPVHKYFFKKCIENDITVYGNQHGINKSILQIIFSAPNKYCKYWNAEGSFMLERFQKVLNVNPLYNRWISLGSPHHEYLYNTFSWNKKNSNNKILLIHEPNLKNAEGDKHPHDSEYIINEVIKTASNLGYEIDLKVHPNWKGDSGNSNTKLRRFECNYVDISLEEVVNYSLVVGSRSSLLYESYIMGIPVFAISSHSDWPDDLISFLSKKIVLSYDLNDIGIAINQTFNSPINQDLNKIKHLSGPIGNVLDNYLKFIYSDREHPEKHLGKVRYKFYLSRLKRTDLMDKLFSKYINYILHKIIITFPKSYALLRFLR